MDTKRWVPQRGPLVLATRVAVPALVVAVLVGALVGPLAAVALTLGLVAGIPSAVAALGVAARCSIGLLMAVGLVLGSAAAGLPWVAALLVAAAALAQAPGNRHSLGSVGLLPVLVALGATVPIPWSPLLVGGWLLTGFGCGAVVVAAAGVTSPRWPVPAPDAWVHGAVTAVASGLALLLAMLLEVSHAYWVVITIVFVLRPGLGRTPQIVRSRVLGTLTGVGIAVLVVPVLPAAVSTALAAGCILLALAGALSDDLWQQTVWGTPPVVLIGSSGLVGEALVIAHERLVVTAASALVALLAASVLLRRETRPRTGGAGGCATPSRGGE